VLDKVAAAGEVTHAAERLLYLLQAGEVVVVRPTRC
jgi:hypothetical protein